MTININAANITSIRLAEQGSNPSTPASGFASLFVDANGDLATRKDAGGIKIATSPASGDYILTVDGTGTAARLNAANVFTSTAQFATTIGVGNATPSASGSGVTFPASQSASTNANTLDDYEEGTWTMGITFGGAAAGVTYSANTGTYTKVGRKVTVAGFLFLSNKGSSTGGARITGLPFTVLDADSGYTGAAIGYLENVTFADVPLCHTVRNATTLELREVTNAGVLTNLSNTDFANNSGIIIGLTYFV